MALFVRRTTNTPRSCRRTPPISRVCYQRTVVSLRRVNRTRANPTDAGTRITDTRVKTLYVCMYIKVYYNESVAKQTHTLLLAGRITHCRRSSALHTAGTADVGGVDALCVCARARARLCVRKVRRKRNEFIAKIIIIVISFIILLFSRIECQT